ncbi:PAS domain S-box protein [Haloparvum sp. PAK95]|uniref:PAS domain S-box protein n=1 Tax=Haloparvum sp. PAK95 TaxID=3418962 RepID=UPI003D2ECF6E
MRADRPTALVVGGDTGTVEFLRATDGLGVIAEPDPGSALAAVEDAAVDCVVACGPTDGGSTPPILERLRRNERFAEVPFVLYPEDGDAALVERSFEDPRTEYVVDTGTPESRALLRNRIRRTVESCRELQARSSGIDSQFFDIAETLAVGIVSVDVDSRIQYVNPAAAEILGYEPEALSGEPLTQLIPKRLRRDHLDAVKRYLETGERNLDWGGIEFPALHRSGEEIPVRIAFSEYEHGSDRYFTGTMIDVRDQEQRRRELERQNERLDRFASVVSHDLRNPLSVAEGNVELVRETGDLDRLDRIEEAHARINAIIDDLLTLAREGAAVEDPSPVSLAAVTEDAWRTVEHGDAELSVECDPTILAARSRLRTLLENLFRNSLEHAGPDVTITLGTLSDGFYVADDGPGVPPDVRDDVFEWGFTTTDGGTGFGLAIVAEVARAHDWTVDLAESDDGGARFEVRGLKREE